MAASHRLRATQPVPGQRAAEYRAAGWWGARRLADGIEAASLASPEGVAVVDNQKTLTWRALAAAVAAATHRLRQRGVGEGDGVVLVAGNTTAGVVAYHAALRTGATTAVLDRRCGQTDLRAAIDALGEAVTVLVSEGERRRLLDGTALACGLTLDALVAGDDDVTMDTSWVEPDRCRPAVVLFTSGTTGRPKGVVHSLDTITAGAANMARITGATERTVLFLVSPLTSITGVMQMHLAADYRATLVLEDHFDPEGSLRRIEQYRASLLGGAPVIAERLLRAAEAQGASSIALRTLALGGAMLPLPLLEVAADRFGIEVARVYGSSEAPNSTGSLPEDPRAWRLGDDGALMPGTEVRVGSFEHEQEGLLRGPAVFLGYADPADNDGAFEDGWYRTGDAVEIHQGRLTVVGRLKEVVNRNGLKIAPAEIDGGLAGLGHVVEYATFGLPDPETGERLVVALRPEAGVRITLDEVCTHLRNEGIATRKLPEQLVVWDEPLPRTASGKVVRTQLAMASAAKASDYAERLRTP
jgi:acyl-CoA synthetase (AMP-forming)/AMP-acid ligase II